MTPTQAKQFNQMLLALRGIAKGYMTPEKLRKNCEKECGLDYEEALEMAYENIQSTAATYSKGIKEIKPENLRNASKASETL